MTKLLANKYVLGAAALLLTLAAIWGYGHHQYMQGVADTKTAAVLANISIEQGMQYERDQADANHRGAVLAREAAEKDAAAVRGRLDRLLWKHRNEPKTTGAGIGPDATGPDWIGVFGACYAEYGDMGKDAARLADQVNGLQGYARALRK